jgi:hypothetical protein
VEAASALYLIAIGGRILVDRNGGQERMRTMTRAMPSILALPTPRFLLSILFFVNILYLFILSYGMEPMGYGLKNEGK